MDSSTRSIIISPARALESFSRVAGTSRRASGTVYTAFTALLGDMTRRSSSADALMSSHARTFRFAARFLPQRYRESTIWLYAFFRTLDDLVDEQSVSSESWGAAVHEIDAWQHWFESGMTRAAPRVEIGTALSSVAREYDIDREYFLAFLSGMRDDLHHVPPASRVEVERYSYKVASTVGLTMTHLFGARTPSVLNAATRLGIAMQLTNILRDIGGDLARGRLYLPHDLLERHSLGRPDIESMWALGDGADERLRSVVAEMIDWADDHYSAGIEGIALLPRDVQMPILLSARLYQRILRQLESGGYDSLRGRAATNRWQKIAEACECLIQTHDSAFLSQRKVKQ